MKTKLSILLILITTIMSGQEFITINAAQDARLAILGDDKGNSAFTPNVIIRSEWQGKDKFIGYGFVYPEFEIAELKGGTYRRYTIGYGRTFYLDRLFQLPFLENFRGTFSAGYGFIDYNGALFSFDFTSQLSYKLDKLKVKRIIDIDISFMEVFIQWQIAERKDLSVYGETFRGSGAVGIKFYVFNTSWDKNK